MTATPDDIARETVVAAFDSVHRFPNAKAICEDLSKRIAAAITAERERAAGILDIKRSVFGAKSLIGDSYTRGLIDARKRCCRHSQRSNTLNE